MNRILAKLYETRIRRGREIEITNFLGEGRDLPARDPEFKREITSALMRLGVKLPKPELRELLCGEKHIYSSTRWVAIRYYHIKF
jgi:hypothetical protein